MSRISDLCSRINTAYERGDTNETLREVEKLANLKVWGKVYDYHDSRKAEVIQDCLLEVWQSNFSGRSLYSTWVVSVINHTISNSIDKIVRERRMGQMLLSLNTTIMRDKDGNEFRLLDSILDGAISCGDICSGSYPSLRDYEAYEVFSPVFSGQMSQKELAVELGLSYDTFRKRLSRWFANMERDLARKRVSGIMGVAKANKWFVTVPTKVI